MSQLSDLELVAQAMAPTETISTPQTQQPPNPRNAPTTNGTSSPKLTNDTIPEDATSLADLDLSKLSVEDRELLQPLIDALRLSEKDGEQNGEVPIEDILAQLDAAEGVADDLEGKLDRLIAALGREEEAIEGGLGEQEAKAQAEKK